MEFYLFILQAVEEINDELFPDVGGLSFYLEPNYNWEVKWESMIVVNGHSAFEYNSNNSADLNKELLKEYIKKSLSLLKKEILNQMERVP